MRPLAVTARTRVGRLPERQRTDRAELDALLDDALVATVSTVREGEPFVLPMAVARDGERLLLHGSSGAGLLSSLTRGARVAVCITRVDALVFARSVFDSSMNYRSAVVFGVPSVLDGDAKLAGLRALTAHLMPGRWEEVRPPTRKELAATTVLSVPLDEASIKVRDAGASGVEADAPGVWAGVVPVVRLLDTAVTAADATADVPASVSRACARFSVIGPAARGQVDGVAVAHRRTGDGAGRG
jgi:nitroimidazol reductase NimA-like FMN-containing flavoprotein (pyridoxamine 5'-phosphate oxidase superfamily)